MWKYLKRGTPQPLKSHATHRHICPPCISEFHSCLLRCRAIESLQPESRGPLHGIPFGVKDNIDVAGLPTTASCEAFKYIPTKSGPVVQVLLDAGTLFGCNSN